MLNRISRDTIAGALLIAIGAGAAWIALGYRLGTARQMGPGYFPMIVASLMVLVGVGVIFRGRLVAFENMGDFRWRPIVCVVAAVALFGLTVDGLGSFLATFLTIICSALGSAKFRLALWPLAGAVALSAGSALVFSVLLGLPMPVIGTWLQPMFGF